MSRYFGRVRWIGYLLYDSIPNYRSLMYLLGCVINILLLFYYQVGYSFRSPFFREIFVLGMVTLGLSSYVTIIYGIRNIPVIVTETKRRALLGSPLGKWTASSVTAYAKSLIMGVIRDESFYYATFALFTVIGLWYDHLVFIYQLSFVVRIELLQGVVSAVWLRRSQLILTLLLIVMIFYYFAMVGYMWFPEQFPHQRCSKLYECVVVTFDL